MQIKLKLLLIIADSTEHIDVPVNKNVVHINCVNRIFPAIHECKPDGIILDYDFLGTDMEKILRRIMSNPFYRGIKIYCCKTKPHTKVDDLLKALGVQQFIYAQQQKQPAIVAPTKTSTSIFKNVFACKLALRFIH